jgi:hypothetical protein
LSFSMGVNADVLDVIRRNNGVAAGRGVSGIRFAAAA